ncbi:putative Kinesin protein [Paratrimastix pyriformis]|uniref:Kinesin protein n=1 Tax=Paratrimastix pyriformis TaxID=342808 RepID=A0ABQ8USS8_9EUKA|nr:putative Kinesin protein [Paratrimastix pyriformis]
MSAESSNINVSIRLRPLDAAHEDEVAQHFAFNAAQPGLISIRAPATRTSTDQTDGTTSQEREFPFDHIFHTSSTQEEIFEHVRPLVMHVLEGFNACCFAFGQTGSGKTYTMIGEGARLRGLIPRCLELLFSSLAARSHPPGTAGATPPGQVPRIDDGPDPAGRRASVFVSLVEIYLDQVRDLGKYYSPAEMAPAAIGRTAQRPPQRARAARGLRPVAVATATALPCPPAPLGRCLFLGLVPAVAHSRASDDYVYSSLDIRESPDGIIYVKDLTAIPVHSVTEVWFDPHDARWRLGIFEILRRGLAKRATYGTDMNDVSSRSHTILTVNLVQTNGPAGSMGPGGMGGAEAGETTSSFLNLVDLAGSERLSRSHSTGQRLKEAAIINKSLSALGNVVRAINCRDDHIPYRDSKLTRILQNSLGGNAFTHLIATVHPALANHDESLATLQFAHRCRNVTNQPRVNYMDTDMASQERRIKLLLDEVASLKHRLAEAETGSTSRLQAMQTQIQQYQQVLGPAGVGGGSGGMATRGPEPAKLLELARSDNKFLRDKLEKRRQDFQSVQRRIMEEKERHVQESQSFRKRMETLANDILVGKQDLVLAINQQLAAHESEVNALIAHNQSLLQRASALKMLLPVVHVGVFFTLLRPISPVLTMIKMEHHALLSSIPASLRAAATERVSIEEAQERARKELHAQHLEQVRALDQSKDQEVAGVRARYEFLLEKRRAELEQCSAEFARFRRQTNDEIHAIRPAPRPGPPPPQENECLYAYAHKLSLIADHAYPFLTAALALSGAPASQPQPPCGPPTSGSPASPSTVPGQPRARAGSASSSFMRRSTDPGQAAPSTVPPRPPSGPPGPRPLRASVSACCTGGRPSTAPAPPRSAPLDGPPAPGPVSPALGTSAALSPPRILRLPQRCRSPGRVSRAPSAGRGSLGASSASAAVRLSASSTAAAGLLGASAAPAEGPSLPGRPPSRPQAGGFVTPEEPPSPGQPPSKRRDTCVLLQPASQLGPHVARGRVEGPSAGRSASRHGNDRLDYPLTSAGTSGHPVAGYIAGLEEDRAQVRERLQAQTERVQALTVAAMAKDRLLAAMQLQRPSQRALSSAGAHLLVPG